MGFSPERRAIFTHPLPQMFCTFWLRNVLRATAACHLSTSQLPKVLRECQFFSILTCKCASRHSGVPFFHSSTFKSGPNPSDLYIFTWNALRATAACNVSCLLWAATSALAALASLLFDPADPQISGKTQHFATFLTFRACGSSFYSLSRNCIFFLLILLLFSAFHLLTLLLCSAFSTVHIVGS